METPLQLIQKAMEEKYKVTLPKVAASRASFGFGLALSYLTHHCDIEVVVLWQKKSRQICISTQVNEPTLPNREGIEDFLKSLAPIAMPYLREFLPSAGSGRILPIHPSEETPAMVAAYLGMVPCKREWVRQVMAHIETSTRFLTVVQAVLKEASSTDVWPSAKRCEEIVRREDAEYDFVQAVENEIKAAHYRIDCPKAEDAEYPTLN